MAIENKREVVGTLSSTAEDTQPTQEGISKPSLSKART